jgi:acyl carrier protein phosphodiesterase
MNFLAHCALADDAATAWQASPDERVGLLAGAVIGDFCKGPITSTWPTPLKAGVRLHRKIDALSNTNAAIAQTCDRFPTRLRRFAPIFVDILADHWLSLRWGAHHHHDIAEFSLECYHAIQDYRRFLDPRAERFVQYMRDEDLLAQYHDWRHVERALQSVLRRLGKSEEFAHINAQMRALNEAGDDEFLQFYPELRDSLWGWNAFEAIAAPRSS